MRHDLPRPGFVDFQGRLFAREPFAFASRFFGPCFGGTGDVKRVDHDHDRRDIIAQRFVVAVSPDAVGVGVAGKPCFLKGFDGGALRGCGFMGGPAAWQDPAPRSTGCHKADLQFFALVAVAKGGQLRTHIGFATAAQFQGDGLFWQFRHGNYPQAG